MKRRLSTIVLSLAASIGLGAGYAPGAMAQAYPTKTIRLVLPVTPGGGTDIISRLVAHKLSTTIGQQVIIDNRPGAGGNIAGEIVAKANPDGYTLIVVTASHATNPSLYSRMSYDPIKDFSPITQLTTQAYIFVVHPSVPVKTVKEFIAFAKSKKDGVTYASSGAGLLGHLGMELLKTLGNFEAVHVPYKGAGPAITDTIAGQVQAFFPTMISGLPHVKSGKVRAIAVTSAKRSPLLPDIPSIAESGFPGYEVNGWYGLLAPAGTPKEIVARLHDETVRVLKMQDVKERMGDDGADAVGNTPQEFSAYIQSEMTKWAKVIKQSGAKAN